MRFARWNSQNYSFLFTIKLINNWLNWKLTNEIHLDPRQNAHKDNFGFFLAFLLWFQKWPIRRAKNRLSKRKIQIFSTTPKSQFFCPWSEKERKRDGGPRLEQPISRRTVARIRERLVRRKRHAIVRRRRKATTRPKTTIGLTLVYIFIIISNI